MVVEVTPAATFKPGTPQVLFKAPPDLSEQGVMYSFPAWDVTADGNRFFMPAPDETSPSPFIIVRNWNAPNK